MNNERVRKAVRLLIAIAILTVIVFVVDLIINRKKSFTDLIVNFTNKTKVKDNNNGVYTYRDQLGKTYSAYNGCSFNYISNYILVIDDNYMLFRSSCMGTYLKAEGKTKDLNIAREDKGSFITLDGKRYDKDDKVKSIVPNNAIASSREGNLDLNSLGIIAKETQFEGNYYEISRSIKGMGNSIMAHFYRNDVGRFILDINDMRRNIYSIAIDDFDRMPEFYTVGNKMIIIEKEDNPADSQKYAYKFRVINGTGVIYDLSKYFPINVNDVTLSYNDSVYVMYDMKDRYYRIFIGKNKKFCVEDGKDAEKVAYYEFKLTYNYQDNAFGKPDFVKIGYEKEGCSYIKQYVTGGL